MKIDFTKAKYQVPTEPKAIDLSHYETHLDVAEAGFTVRDGQRTRVKERNTKDTIYFSDDDRNNVIKRDAENMDNDSAAAGTKVRIKGGAGNGDYWVGYYEEAIIIAGAGNDNITAQYSSIGYIDAGPGNDVVHSESNMVKLGGGNDCFYADWDQSIDQRKGGNAWADAGNDFMHGSRGEDLLMGGGGKDKIKGYAGADILNGGQGNDKIICGSGNDYAKPGRGNDTIELGTGRDIFDLSRGKDKAKDFNINEDSVVIDAGFLAENLRFTDTKKGCYITNGDDVNTLFKGVNADQLAAIVDLA